MQMPPRKRYPPKSSMGGGGGEAKRTYAKRSYSSKGSMPAKKRKYSKKAYRSTAKGKPYRGARKGFLTTKWPVIDRLTEHATRKHVTNYYDPTVWTFGTGGGGGVVSTSEVAPRDYFYVDCNNIYTPGVQNSATSIPIPAASGFTQMNALYRMWHVEGVKYKVKIVVQTSGDGGGTGLGAQYELGLAAMSNFNNGASPTIDWDDWKRQRYFKKTPIVFGKDRSVVENASLEMYVRPDEIDGLTTSTAEYAGAAYFGIDTTPPTQKPTFWVMVFGLKSQSQIFQYVLYHELTYYVKWVNPKMVPSTSLRAILDGESLPDEVEGEEKKEEKEEEKKEEKESSLPATPLSLAPLGLLDDDDYDPVVDHPLKKVLATAKCNNPAHPIVGHHRMPTCSYTLML